MHGHTLIQMHKHVHTYEQAHTLTEINEYTQNVLCVLLLTYIRFQYNKTQLSLF